MIMKRKITYLEGFRTLPADQLARLLLCPNQTVRRNNLIPCTRGTPEHTSCDDCISKFLQTEVNENDSTRAGTCEVST